MKKLLLLLIGFIPFAVGYGLNALMLGAYYDTALPYGWIGVSMLVIWFGLGMLARPLGESAFQSAMVVHIPGLLVLALILYQELVLGQYWLNAVGFATQLFFLPLIYLSGIITFFASAMSAVYISAFLLLFTAFWLGGRLRTHRQKQQA